VPRNRTLRLAVLGSSVQRAASPKYTSRAGLALKRRFVVGLFVLLSLMLITIYFREAPTGGLHSLQGAGATVLRPFQVGVERVARPFRDVYGYFSGLVHAKAENERLRQEVVDLRQLLTQNQAARQENVQLRALLDYRAPATYPGDYEQVAAAVIAHQPSQFEQHVVISAGSSDGVAVNDPVVDGDGLVGLVTQVTSRTAKVVLLTDQASAVSALDVAAGSGASGLIQPGRPGSDSLNLNRVSKDKVVSPGDRIVTAGSQSGKLGSLFPRGIPIGQVTSVGQSDTDFFKRIQVDPYVDFNSLDSVIVLVPARSDR
jgi:rod shape-determining protein MreC